MTIAVLKELLRSWRSIKTNKCTLLTVFLVVFLLGEALPLSPAFKGTMEMLFFIGMLLAPYFVSHSRKIFIATVIAGILLLVPKLLVSFHLVSFNSAEQHHYAFFCLGVLTLFELLLTAFLMVSSLRHREQLVLIPSCLLAFLLVAVMFGDVYFLLNALLPGAFLFNGQPFPPTANDLFYFSMITLTTCGFGDITPLHPLVRSLAGLEAVCGVMFVALFIGRLIGGKTGRW